MINIALFVIRDLFLKSGVTDGCAVCVYATLFPFSVCVCWLFRGKRANWTVITLLYKHVQQTGRRNSGAMGEREKEEMVSWWIWKMSHFSALCVCNMQLMKRTDKTWMYRAIANKFEEFCMAELWNAVQYIWYYLLQAHLACRVWEKISRKEMRRKCRGRGDDSMMTENIVISDCSFCHLLGSLVNKWHSQTQADSMLWILNSIFWCTSTIFAFNACQCVGSRLATHHKKGNVWN